ncbi:Maf family protein [Aequoribacter sp.]|jgi:septum formation protein|uniref:Maf family protein n=1 Tax=Aequoribacter sp. TaxID=2847771 RepID=UPI003F695FA7
MVILASQSPRRRELLARIVMDFQVRPADVDESPLAHESPEQYVQRLAHEKATKVQELYAGSCIIAADTTVVLDDLMLQKPESEQEAFAMLSSLRGREHRVLTGLAVYTSMRRALKVVSTRVRFANVSDDLLKAYIATGEPSDKAGAYALQGVGDVLVESIEGSVSNVIGLPLQILSELLVASGVNLSLSRSVD